MVISVVIATAKLNLDRLCVIDREKPIASDLKLPLLWLFFVFLQELVKKRVNDFSTTNNKLVQLLYRGRQSRQSRLKSEATRRFCEEMLYYRAKKSP